MTATAGAREVIGEATLGELEGTLRGRLLRPSDPGYDQARLVWNAAHDRRPALIIGCAGTADVIRAVEFARSEGLQLAVRGGGHSVAGFDRLLIAYPPGVPLAVPGDGGPPSCDSTLGPADATEPRCTSCPPGPSPHPREHVS
jgi:hypothetical protein